MKHINFYCGPDSRNLPTPYNALTFHSGQGIPHSITYVTWELAPNEFSNKDAASISYEFVNTKMSQIGTLTNHDVYKSHV